MTKLNCLESIIFISLLTLLSVKLFNGNAKWLRIKVRLGSIVPNAIAVKGGQMVTLHCGSSSPVEWVFPRHVNISNRYVQFGNSITFKNLQRADTGIYCCSGKFSEDDRFYEAASIRIVNGPISGLVLPSRVEATEGSSVVLECGSIKPVKWIGLQLYVHNSPNNKLILNQLKKSSSGPFMCIGVNEKSEVFHQVVRVIVDGFVEVIQRSFIDYFENMNNNFTGRYEALMSYIFAPSL